MYIKIDSYIVNCFIVQGLNELKEFVEGVERDPTFRVHQPGAVLRSVGYVYSMYNCLYIGVYIRMYVCMYVCMYVRI